MYHYASNTFTNGHVVRILPVAWPTDTLIAAICIYTALVAAAVICITLIYIWKTTFNRITLIIPNKGKKHLRVYGVLFVPAKNYKN